MLPYYYLLQGISPIYYGTTGSYISTYPSWKSENLQFKLIFPS